MLASEIKDIAEKAISNLLGGWTPRSQEVCDSMDADSHDNIIFSELKRSLQSDIRHENNLWKVHRPLQEAVRENKNWFN